jgi:hypothetical protein
MPDKPLTKAKLALKLLDESDPEAAELVRDEKRLRRRILRLAVDSSITSPRFVVRKRESKLPQVWPLSIDESFWGDWAFVKWQALRRNPRYQREVRRFYSRHSPEIFQSAEINHLFQDYTPSFGPAENPFSWWLNWAIRRSLRMKTSQQVETELIERQLAEAFTTKGINLWPVQPKVCFPHPYFLDKLRPLPFAIPIEPINRKDKVPLYATLLETGLRRPKYLRVDISLPKDVLRRSVMDYLGSLKVLNLKSRDSGILTPEARRKRVKAKLMGQLPRRSISLHAKIAPNWFCVWDLKRAGLQFPQIAGCLFPNEYDPDDPNGYPSRRPGEKYECIQRVQDYHEKAQLLINFIFDPPANSII